MTQPTRTPGAADRARALGKELTAIHNWLRSELSRVATELDNYLTGGAPPTHLQAHCLAFCQALTDHHRSEDRTAFPALSRQFPELAPVLAGLSEDHQFISDILGRMRSLLTTVTPVNAQDVRSELAGLSAIVESHFQWEERRIATALDQLADQNRSSEELFGINPTEPTVRSNPGG
ncbi:hemerythrin domain-containing protein [Nocardia panacis]|uniref:Hemerythrin domain-containing protein n=1 Tax=Nocardia panacis TaxID=2340916 RepID=A0A3A4KTU5_9NOCA|nr:hemerythrin domain-containing protein [Nocardia panacis]RJO79806.1 hemerythrin domain-containing protein [Nocardia panacis]